MITLLDDEAPSLLCIQETKLKVSDESDWTEVHGGYTTHFSSSGPPGKNG
jgi:exonuclease III